MSPSAPVSVAFNTAGIISLLIGVVLPNAVGYFTNESMNKGLKAAILAGLSGVSAVLAQWLDALNNHQHFLWQASVLSALTTWLLAEGTYLRIWKPSGLSDKLQRKGVTDAKLGVTPLAQPSDDSGVSDQDPGYVSRHSMSLGKIGLVQSTPSSPEVTATSENPA
jgi:hypothetical protein